MTIRKRSRRVGSDLSTRASALNRGRLPNGDLAFRLLAAVATALALLLVALMVLQSVQTAWPVFERFGIAGFVTGQRWSPSFDDLRRLAVHLRHAADQRHRADHRRTDRRCSSPCWSRSSCHPAGRPLRRRRRGLAGGRPFGRLGTVGSAGSRPVHPAVRARRRGRPGQADPVPGSAHAGAQLLRGRPDRGPDDRADRRRRDARGLRSHAPTPARGGAGSGRDALGRHPPRRAADRPNGRGRRRAARPGPGHRRDDRRDDGHRQRPARRRLRLLAGLHPGQRHRQRVQRGHRAAPRRGAHRAGRRAAGHGGRQSTAPD